MVGDQKSPWQRRYEAGTARERAGNEAWVKRRFGVPIGRTIAREVPWALGLFLLLSLLQDWVWGLVGALGYLVVMLVFRAWARRRHGVSTTNQ
ncbi:MULTISPECIES: hypothetical protein [unclassified Geodermatophilus]|uniref:hypothetical protein n=1 Tax=unclassified Geodermatophilus TaxID=2637632 RepID=UPI003EE871BD